LLWFEENLIFNLHKLNKHHLDIKIQVIQAAINEIAVQSWGVTEQYLQVHDVQRLNGVPQVARVDMERDDGIAIVYFPINNEKFYLAIYLNTIPEIEIRYIDTEDNNAVYLRATSATHTYQEIAAMTTLQPTEVFNKGDQKKSGKAFYNYSCANYEPNPEPDEFEDKLRKLLDYLEQDKQGVTALVNNSEAYIQVDMDIHNGNGLIGGPRINKASIKRMAALDLEISFSQYVTGNPFV
jgi:hypothetical protein